MCLPSCSIVTDAVGNQLVSWQHPSVKFLTFNNRSSNSNKYRRILTVWRLSPIVSFRRVKRQLPGPSPSPSQTENILETSVGLKRRPEDEKEPRVGKHKGYHKANSNESGSSGILNSAIQHSDVGDKPKRKTRIVDPKSTLRFESEIFPELNKDRLVKREIPSNKNVNCNSASTSVQYGGTDFRNTSNRGTSQSLSSPMLREVYSDSGVQTPWPGNLSAISWKDQSLARTNEVPSPGNLSRDPSWMLRNAHSSNSVSVLSRDSGFERGRIRGLHRDKSLKNGKGDVWKVEKVDDSILELMPLKPWSEQPDEYRGTLAVQVSRREIVRCILIEELQGRSIRQTAAVTIASKVPVLVNSLLLEAKQADWAAYSRGLPLTENLPDQIRDILERNGTLKIVSYLHNLGMEASSIGRALNLCNLQFGDVVAKVQLLHSVGVRPRAAAQVLIGCPNFLGMPLEALRANMACLQAVGVKGVDLGRVIEVYPKLLSPAVQVCMQPCVRYLHELGILPRGISKVIRTYPQILGCSVTATLQPAVHALRGAGLSKADLVRAVTKCPGLLACSVESNILPSLNFLESLMEDKGTVSKLVARNPEVLTLNIERNVIPTLDYFESIGMHKKAVSKMVLRNGRVLCCSLPNIASKVNLLESFGLTRNEVMHMISLFPSIVNYREETLRAKHSYLVEKMGRRVQEIVIFPHYFGYHLETRIEARHKRLEGISASCAVNTMLVCSDESFDNLCFRLSQKSQQL